MVRILYLLLISILVSAVVVAGVYFGIPHETLFKMLDNSHDPPLTVEKDMVSTVSGEPIRKISVFFVGNSFTSTYDLPGTLIKVASSDPTNKVELEVYPSLRSGAHLKGIWSDARANQLFRSRHWDYLVLQEQSGWTNSPPETDETYSAVKLWTEAAKEVSAIPLFFENWADGFGSTQYSNQDYYLYAQDPDEVQKRYSKESKALAETYGMTIIPLGDYWAYVRKQPNAPDLYYQDKHHPSVAGTYLNALIFYRCLTGNLPAHVTYRPSELTEEQAKFLIDVVSK